MLPDLAKIKGIHPGAVLKREIKQRGLKNKELAILVNEHAQTICAITKERRNITPLLSIKLGKSFNIGYDYFMLLQTYYDLKKAQSKSIGKELKPDLKKIRKALFWDTAIEEIDWQKYKRAVIKRIFERGNEQEINVIMDFYGKEIVKSELDEIKDSLFPAFMLNKEKLLGVDENI